MATPLSQCIKVLKIGCLILIVWRVDGHWQKKWNDAQNMADSVKASYLLEKLHEPSGQGGEVYTDVPCRTQQAGVVLMLPI